MNFKRLVILSFICTACHAEVPSKQDTSKDCFSGKTALTAKKVWFFGFKNDPEKEKCRSMDVEKLKDYKCEYVKYSFGGETPAYSFTNRKGKYREYIVYPTLSDCKDGIETIIANGP